MPSIAVLALSLGRDAVLSPAPLLSFVGGVRRLPVSLPARTGGGAITAPLPPVPAEPTPAAVAAELAGGATTVPPAAAELPARTEEPPAELDPAPTAETALAADEP